MGFGQRVKDVLDARGLKPADLSHMLGWNTGVLSQYMKNPDRDPRLSTAIAVAVALDVSLDYLAGEAEEPLPLRRSGQSAPTYSDPRQADVNDAWESMNEDGRDFLWKGAVAARRAYDKRGGSADVQEVVG